MREATLEIAKVGFTSVSKRNDAADFARPDTEREPHSWD
jgi:hypothetical protein